MYIYTTQQTYESELITEPRANRCLNCCAVAATSSLTSYTYSNMCKCVKGCKDVCVCVYVCVYVCMCVCVCVCVLV